jgi:hypothetical protein
VNARQHSEPSGRAFSFFEGRLASAAQNASIQASDRALIMLPRARNFAWQRLEKIRYHVSSSQRGHCI